MSETDAWMMGIMGGIILMILAGWALVRWSERERNKAEEEMRLVYNDIERARRARATEGPEPDFNWPPTPGFSQRLREEEIRRQIGMVSAMRAPQRWDNDPDKERRERDMAAGYAFMVYDHDQPVAPSYEPTAPSCPDPGPAVEPSFTDSSSSSSCDSGGGGGGGGD